MQVLRINEPCDVYHITYSRKGKRRDRERIVKIRHGNTEYKIASLTARWEEREGAYVIDCYTCKTDAGEVLWLKRKREDETWILVEMQIL